MTPRRTGRLVGLNRADITEVESAAELIGQTLRPDKKFPAATVVDYVHRRYDVREDVVRAALLYMLDRGLAFSDSASRISSEPLEPLRSELA